MLTGRKLLKEPKLSLRSRTHERLGLLFWAIAMLCIGAFEHAHDAWLSIGSAGGPLL